MKPTEEQIQKRMKILGCTRDEAIQCFAEDEEVDRMTSAKDIDSDLTAEQRKSAKQARQADRKPTVYKFDTEKRKRKENAGKQEIVSALISAVTDKGAENLTITNNEREFLFEMGGTKYKVTLACPRS